jgi:hypothetical protein
LSRKFANRMLRQFHRPSSGIMVATRSLIRQLKAFGLTNLKSWLRGLDTALFRPTNAAIFDLPHRIFLYVGRVAIEKNIEACLTLSLPGSKAVAGDGPQFAQLKQRDADVHFAGAKTGEELVRHYASADVFVFPSRTDTFGLVMLEALAASLPVAAYPVPGPLDIIDGADVGVLDENLGVAARKALHIPPARCRDYAMTFCWRRCAEQFFDNLVTVRWPLGTALVRALAAWYAPSISAEAKEALVRNDQDGGRGPRRHEHPDARRTATGHLCQPSPGSHRLSACLHGGGGRLHGRLHSAHQTDHR